MFNYLITLTNGQTIPISLSKPIHQVYECDRNGNYFIAQPNGDKIYFDIDSIQ